MWLIDLYVPPSICLYVFLAIASHPILICIHPVLSLLAVRTLHFAEIPFLFRSASQGRSLIAFSTLRSMRPATAPPEPDGLVPHLCDSYAMLGACTTARSHDGAGSLPRNGIMARFGTSITWSEPKRNANDCIFWVLVLYELPPAHT